MTYNDQAGHIFPSQFSATSSPSIITLVVMASVHFDALDISSQLDTADLVIPSAITSTMSPMTEIDFRAETFTSSLVVWF